MVGDSTSLRGRHSDARRVLRVVAGCDVVSRMNDDDKKTKSETTYAEDLAMPKPFASIEALKESLQSNVDNIRASLKDCRPDVAASHRQAIRVFEEAIKTIDDILPKTE